MSELLELSMDQAFIGRRDPQNSDRTWDLIASSRGVPHACGRELVSRLSLWGPALFDEHLEELAFSFPLTNDPQGRWAFCRGSREDRQPFNAFFFHAVLLEFEQRKALGFNPLLLYDLLQIRRSGKKVESELPRLKLGLAAWTMEQRVAQALESYHLLERTLSQQFLKNLTLGVMQPEPLLLEPRLPVMRLLNWLFCLLPSAVASELSFASCYSFHISYPFRLGFLPPSSPKTETQWNTLVEQWQNRQCHFIATSDLAVSMPPSMYMNLIWDILTHDAAQRDWVKVCQPQAALGVLFTLLSRLERNINIHSQPDGEIPVRSLVSLWRTMSGLEAGPEVSVEAGLRLLPALVDSGKQDTLTQAWIKGINLCVDRLHGRVDEQTLKDLKEERRRNPDGVRVVDLRAVRLKDFRSVLVLLAKTVLSGPGESPAWALELLAKGLRVMCNLDWHFFLSSVGLVKEACPDLRLDACLQQSLPALRDLDHMLAVTNDFLARSGSDKGGEGYVVNWNRLHEWSRNMVLLCRELPHDEQLERSMLASLWRVMEYGLAFVAQRPDEVRQLLWPPVLGLTKASPLGRDSLAYHLLVPLSKLVLEAASRLGLRVSDAVETRDLVRRQVAANELLMALNTAMVAAYHSPGINNDLDLAALAGEQGAGRVDELYLALLGRLEAYVPAQGQQPAQDPGRDFVVGQLAKLLEGQQPSVGTVSDDFGERAIWQTLNNLLPTALNRLLPGLSACVRRSMSNFEEAPLWWRRYWDAGLRVAQVPELGQDALHLLGECTSRLLSHHQNAAMVYKVMQALWGLEGQPALFWVLMARLGKLFLDAKTKDGLEGLLPPKNVQALEFLVDKGRPNQSGYQPQPQGEWATGLVLALSLGSYWSGDDVRRKKGEGLASHMVGTGYYQGVNRKMLLGWKKDNPGLVEYLDYMDWMA